jgi:hypothetical protein
MSVDEVRSMCDLHAQVLNEIRDQPKSQEVPAGNLTLDQLQAIFATRAAARVEGGRESIGSPPKHELLTEAGKRRVQALI